MTFLCPRCEQMHEAPPLAYAARAPITWYDIPEHEREQRALLTEERCEIDDRHFFVRGRVVLPVRDADDDFEWGVWVSLSERSYERALELWNAPGREREPAIFGWLSTSLPVYPDTVNLKTMVHTGPLGERPLAELEPTDHPLAVEQREGITMARVQEIAVAILHG